MRGRCFNFLLSGLWLLALALSARASVPGPTTAPSKSAVVVLRGVIDDYSRDQMFRRFAQARAEGADKIILLINTPGGQVTSAMEMSRFLKQQKDLHITAFIENWALSAGAMISLACDEIVMQPNAKLGDCAPIAMDSQGGLQRLEGTERAKMESPILEDFYESSLRNGYDPLLTQSMVAMGRVVHWMENSSGNRQFVNESDYVKLIKDGEWKPVPGVRDPLDSADTLLTVNTDLAIKLGLAKGQFDTPEALAAQRGWTIIDTFQPGPGEQFIQWLAGAAVRGIILVIFLQALYMAFSHPGHGWPEAVALTSLGLLIGIPMLTGYAQWWEVLAVFLGIALLALEIFVVPGFGITGISGILLLVIGLVLTFVGKEPAHMPGWLPQLSGTWASLQKGLLIVTGGLIGSLLLSFWLQRYLYKLPYFSRLVLSNVSGASGTISTIANETNEGIWPGIGVTGLAVTELKPGGSAEFIDLGLNDRRMVSVVSDSGFVEKGTKVVVIEISGNRVVVRPLRDRAASIQPEGMG